MKTDKSQLEEFRKKLNDLDDRLKMAAGGIPPLTEQVGDLAITLDHDRTLHSNILRGLTDTVGTLELEWVALKSEHNHTTHNFRRSIKALASRLEKLEGEPPKLIEDEIPQQNCRSCRFYGTNNTCRRNAPIPNWEHQRNTGSYFPLMEEGDWCAEWAEWKGIT